MAAPIYSGGYPFFKGGIRTKYKVIPSGAAAVQITRSQSNAIFLFDTGAGIIYTLPTAVPGLSFTFCTTVTVTANGHKVITKNATELLIGAVSGYNTASSDAALTFSSVAASSNIAVNQLAASTNQAGGMIGSIVTFVCLTATQWLVQGQIQAGTTFVTPFASS
jgi:hypothetical protein